MNKSMTDNLIIICSIWTIIWCLAVLYIALKPLGNNILKAYRKSLKTEPDVKLTYLQCEGYTRTGKGKWRRVA